MVFTAVCLEAVLESVQPRACNIFFREHNNDLIPFPWKLLFFFSVESSIGVARSKMGASGAALLLTVWIVFFQTQWRSWGGWVVGYMATIPQADATNW